MRSNHPDQTFDFLSLDSNSRVQSNGVKITFDWERAIEVAPSGVPAVELWASAPLNRSGLADTRL
jgi:hypothetical protein